MKIISWNVTGIKARTDEIERLMKARSKRIYAAFCRITEQHISAAGRLFRVRVEGGRDGRICRGNYHKRGISEVAEKGKQKGFMRHSGASLNNISLRMGDFSVCAWRGEGTGNLPGKCYRGMSEVTEKADRRGFMRHSVASLNNISLRPGDFSACAWRGGKGWENLRGKLL